MNWLGTHTGPKLPERRNGFHRLLDVVGELCKLRATHPVTLERPVGVGRPQPVVVDLEGLAVGQIAPAGHPVALEARVAVRPPCDFVGREQVATRSSVLPRPRPLTSC